MGKPITNISAEGPSIVLKEHELPSRSLGVSFLWVRPYFTTTAEANSSTQNAPQFESRLL